MQEIEVMGPNGMPMYVTGILDQGEYTANEKYWILHSLVEEQTGVLLSAIVHSCCGGHGTVEIHVGGSFFKIFCTLWDPDAILAMLQYCCDEKERHCYLIDNDKIFSVSFLRISVGPVILEDINIATFLELRDCLDPLSKIKPTLQNLGIRDVGSDDIHYCTCNREEKRRGGICNHLNDMLYNPNVVGKREEEKRRVQKRFGEYEEEEV
eukprot:scaffold51535_cov54-Attheya_sp.AAC.2